VDYRDGWAYFGFKLVSPSRFLVSTKHSPPLDVAKMIISAGILYA